MKRVGRKQKSQKKSSKRQEPELKVINPHTAGIEITVLRSYLRQRENLIQASSTHVQRMQRALTQMNLQLHKVISDLTGVTGLNIVRAIIA